MREQEFSPEKETNRSSSPYEIYKLLQRTKGMPEAALINEEIKSILPRFLEINKKAESLDLRSRDFSQEFRAASYVRQKDYQKLFLLLAELRLNDSDYLPEEAEGYFPEKKDELLAIASVILADKHQDLDKYEYPEEKEVGYQKVQKAFLEKMREYADEIKNKFIKQEIEEAIEDCLMHGERKEEEPPF